MATRTLAPAPPTDVVAARLDALWRRIEGTGRDPATVTVIAVTKGFTADAVTAARAVGLVDVGENYASELLSKAAAASPLVAGRVTDPVTDPLTNPTRWHYLGAVQRGRVPRLAPLVSCWQTVCRVVEGEAIAARAPGAAVFVEVDATDIEGRNGAPRAQVPALVSALRALGLDVRGLMAVARPGAPEASRPVFRETAALAAELGLHELSMGMSDDLEVALSEGSTMVRVGRALFGQRPSPGA